MHVFIFQANLVVEWTKLPSHNVPHHSPIIVSDFIEWMTVRSRWRFSTSISKWCRGKLTAVLFKWNWSDLVILGRIQMYYLWNVILAEACETVKQQIWWEGNSLKRCRRMVCAGDSCWVETCQWDCLTGRHGLPCIALSLGTVVWDWSIRHTGVGGGF